MIDTEALPPGWTARPAVPADVEEMAEVASAHDHAVVGAPTLSATSVRAAVAGPGAGARRHLVVRDGDGRLAGWASLHDRAAGRTVVTVRADPALDDTAADGVAALLLGWVEREGSRLALERGLEATQLDAGAFVGDVRQHRWLATAGYSHVRTWWQMSRPVSPEEAVPEAFPAPAEGVTIRQVVAEDGQPSHEDLRAVHDVLETAFADHFNYHQETFEEFLVRQQQEPGHAWDHWWLAELAGAGPVGALVGEAQPGPDGAPGGSYVAYLGVTRAARGRGVARALVHAVIADAARRGRSRVGLEVDADSPTGATRLYEAMGFRTRYATESWHRDLTVR